MVQWRHGIERLTPMLCSASKPRWQIRQIHSYQALDQELVDPQNAPPSALTNPAQYDDFVATHQNQTPFIHFSGTFLGWHRYFVWHYEQALRNECDYKGYQPVRTSTQLPSLYLTIYSTGTGVNGRRRPKTLLSSMAIHIAWGVMGSIFHMLVLSSFHQ